MAYPQRGELAVIPSTTSAHLSPLSLTAAATTYARWLCNRSIMLKQFLFHVTTATTTATAAVIRIKKHLSYGVSAGQVSIATITIPNSSSVGSVLYKNFSPVQFAPGDEICIDVVNAGTDPGTANGAGFPSFQFDLEPESEANASDMTASA